jgi:hypothetical protein
VDKQERKYLKGMTTDVHVATREVEGEDYSGITVAFKPAISNTNCKMLLVSVSYCATEDIFKAGRGKGEARLKFLSNEVVKLPLAAFFRECGPAITGGVLLDMFQV